MKRKINRVGQNTLTVSLPSKWVAMHHLKAGEEVEVVEDGKALHIGLEEIKPAHKSVTVNFPTEKEYVTRRLTGQYLRGTDEIRVQFRDSKVINSVLKDQKEFLMGFEMMQQTGDHCVLKNVSKGLDTEFDTLFNRLFFIVMTFNDEVLKLLKSKDKTGMQGLYEYEHAANRINLFCRRLVNKNAAAAKNLTSISTYEILVELERIGDELKQLLLIIEKTDLKKFEITKINERFFEFTKKCLKTSQHVATEPCKEHDATLLSESFGDSNKLLREVNLDISKHLKTDALNQALVVHNTSVMGHLKHMSEELI